MLEYGQQAGSTHPTGMHSCLELKFVLRGDITIYYLQFTMNKLSIETKTIPHIIAGWLESANSSTGCTEIFQRGRGEKSQDFMLMRLINPSNIIGCGMDPQPIRNLRGLHLYCGCM